jgi:hypothetical protein
LLSRRLPLLPPPAAAGGRLRGAERLPHHVIKTDS